MKGARFNWFDVLVILLLIVFFNRLAVIRAERRQVATTFKNVAALIKVEDVSPPLVTAAQNGLGQPVTNLATGQALGELVAVSSEPTPVVSRPGGPTGPSRLYRNLDLTVSGPGQVGTTVVMLGPAQLHIGTALTIGIPGVSWSGLVWELRSPKQP